MSTLEQLKAKYPGAQAWQIGDSPALADELATLVASGIKTASCGSFACWQAEDPAPKLGSYNIILNGRDEPVCVIRIISLRLTRFCDVTEAFARKEGEGDLSSNTGVKSISAFSAQPGSSLKRWSWWRKNLKSWSAFK